MQTPSTTKKVRQKDEAWRRAALRYSVLIIVLGLLGGTCLGVQIAKVEALNDAATEAQLPPD